MRRISLLVACLYIVTATAIAAVELPLEQGYYVDADTPCADASNATIRLVTREVFNWPQQSCRIAEASQPELGVFEVILDCEATTDLPAERRGLTLTVTSGRQFGLSWQGETPAVARFCAQADLPEPWHSNDLSSMTD